MGAAFVHTDYTSHGTLNPFYCMLSVYENQSAGIKKVTLGNEPRLV